MTFRTMKKLYEVIFAKLFFMKLIPEKRNNANILFLVKMTGVNIFGEALSSNKNITVQKRPPGIGFKLYVRSDNFAIEKKRLANAAKPEEYSDAINKTYSDD